MSTPSPFATGAYTTEQTPDKVSVPPPLDKPAKRRLWFAAFLLFAVGCMCGAFMHNGVRDEPLDPDSHIEACTEEDGSTQEICSFQGTNGEVINLDYGHWTYIPAVGTVTEFPQEG